MRKMKKSVAIALVAAMAMGSTMTALAADSASGETVGTGTSEGHVEKVKVQVDLPVLNASDPSPFSYKMDAEGLIQETGGAKYTDADFPAKNGDTGVYFLAGTREAVTTYNKKDAKPDEYIEFSALTAPTDKDAYDALTPTQKLGIDVTYTKKATNPDDPDNSVYDTLPNNNSDAGWASVTEPQKEKYYDVTYAKKGTQPAEYKDFADLDDELASDAAPTDADLLACYNAPRDAGPIYANESAPLKVTSRSSRDINLTVKAEVQNAKTTDITLVQESAISGATNPSLYLGLVVDSETPAAVLKDTAATKTVTIAGKPNNFKADVNADKDGYEYRELTLDEYKALTGNGDKEALEWDSKEFKLEGAVAKKDVTSATTAPEVKVTWSWVDPLATPASKAPSAAQSTYTVTQGTAVVVDIDLGIGEAGAESIKSLTFVKPDETINTISAEKYTFSNGKLTLPLAATDSIITLGLQSRVFTITFDNDATVQVTLIPAAG